MIPVNLQKGLKKRIEKAFKNLSFKAPYPQTVGDKVPLTVFEQTLPVKKANDNSFYPYVLIKLFEGEQKTADSASDIVVGFIIGTFDDSEDNLGHQDVSRIINGIWEDIQKNPIIDGQFELDFPLRWKIHDEDVDPYYFGMVEARWKAPTYSRIDVEEFL